MAVGTFNRFRWPLLLDADEACRKLNDRGISARVAVLSSAIDPEGASRLSKAQFVDILADPGDRSLPSYLTGADLMLLAEGFDEAFVAAIRLSISSKAHLFMYSRHPIIVYAHTDTGIAKYAAAHGWGRVVSERSPNLLAEAIFDLLSRPAEAEALVLRADQTARRYHANDTNQASLLNSLTHGARASE
jgi:hypothetical protein